jgi:uncharacterized Zn finger protein (UPF0148 family)
VAKTTDELKQNFDKSHARWTAAQASLKRVTASLADAKRALDQAKLSLQDAQQDDAALLAKKGPADETCKRCNATLTDGAGPYFCTKCSQRVVDLTGSVTQLESVITGLQEKLATERVIVEEARIAEVKEFEEYATIQWSVAVHDAREALMATYRTCARLAALSRASNYRCQLDHREGGMTRRGAQLPEGVSDLLETAIMKLNRTRGEGLEVTEKLRAIMLAANTAVSEECFLPAPTTSVRVRPMPKNTDLLSDRIGGGIHILGSSD